MAKRHHSITLYGLLIIASFLGLMYLMAFIWQLGLVVSFLLSINLLTFVVYGYDKKVSGGRIWRLPERFLHLLAALGGSPGAFVAQRVFRHKTAKSSFQRVYWSIVAIQLLIIAAGVWYFDCLNVTSADSCLANFRFK